MSSKQTILTAIRRHNLPEAPLPSLEQSWITFADLRQQFASVLEFVGGRAVSVADVSALSADLAANPNWSNAKKTASLIDGLGGNTKLDDLTDPHATEDIDFAVLPGEFAVAENGAVWITDTIVKHRAVYFIAQHLALVVRATEIVPNMYEAYRRLSFGSAGFGAFISGPSKTADIEQALVIGAHGPRSMTVYLIGD